MNMTSRGPRWSLRAGLVAAASGAIALGSAATATATTEPDGLVDAARSGFDAYLDEVDPPDAGSDPDELDGCPLLSPAQFDEVIAALGYKGSFEQRMAVLGADAIELDEADVEYPVLVCGAEVPSEVRSTPGVQVGAVRLPDEVAFADIIAAEQVTTDDEDLPEITGPVPGGRGGEVTTICEVDGGCGVIWENAGLVVFVSVDQTALEQLGEPDWDSGFEALLEPVLRNLAELRSGGGARTHKPCG